MDTCVKVNLCHNISSSKIPEVRFELCSSIMAVKQAIEKRYGSSSESMELVLQDKEGNTIATMENHQTLGFYQPKDSYWIYVIDLNPSSILKELEDVSKVEKYTMSEEAYDKLPDNYRKFKVKLLENNPELKNKNIITDPEYLKNMADQIQKEQRCRLIDQEHRGTVKYVGIIHKMGLGYWVGVQLDEPFGKNNGMYMNDQYFACPNNYGIFCRPDNVEVGDFPELDFLDELDEI